MRLLPSLSTFFLVGALSAQSPALIGYWHNWDIAGAPYISLDQIDPRYDVIEVSFAEPVFGSTSQMVFTPSATDPTTFAAQVAALRSSGHKVLISIGGANATVQLNSDAERDELTASMLGILADFGFDGIDIDLEGASISITGGTITTPIDAPMLRLIQAIEDIGDAFELNTGTPMMLTMAPETASVQGGQSAFGSIWGAYLPLIHALRDRLDILQVQLYNSGSMYGIDGAIYDQGTADFIVSQTEAVIQGFTTSGGPFNGLAPEQIAVGLPACADAAGGGYSDTATVAAALRYLHGTGPQPGSYTLAQTAGYPALRGMMTWSINWDAAGSCDGTYSFAENYERIFQGNTTAVAALSKGPALLLSPNPATDIITVRGLDQGTHAVNILDLSGRVLRTMALRWTTPSISVSDLPAGSYFLRFDADQKQRPIAFVKIP
ncbi:MAG: T9SS type A sorting domain-containing protein [Flavobacteriales bacterium]|jgi:chitinase|nr:T9SS type A sorting domain-containing protein [Flavobacteriales bacterium]MBK6893897.1 T9SS type A sorting domain-containing protein [Flavobacteriales bacterium]MBK7247841.1 T9SS type A sorting domain-containing protein [Flavobacteriales bacterium]MBK9597216.1 T9SS type A sorting domain-containing protein [Flavobacteriales bacterium]QQS73110.1 MAG: T9SS type A sorting domain-containing protein [Flavobacteriales bacterium]